MQIFVSTIITFNLWTSNFATGIEPFQSNPRNPVNIYHTKEGALNSKGTVKIIGTPNLPGRASAWMYIDSTPCSPNTIVSFFMKGNNKKVRFRILYKKPGSNSYLYLKTILTIKTEWQKIEIPLKDAKPLWSSNYPYALVPGKNPDFFLFIENGDSGQFEVIIDEMAIEETK